MARYDSAGNQMWIDQLGTTNDDTPTSLRLAVRAAFILAALPSGASAAL
jgi:hypothetical protein